MVLTTGCIAVLKLTSDSHWYDPGIGKFIQIGLVKVPDAKRGNFPS